MKKIIGTILIIILTISFIVLYSHYVETSFLTVNEIPLTMSIDKSYDGLKIVHFSDLHYGKLITKKQITNLREKINYINPDIVIFTGDLIDEKSSNINTNFIKNELSKITAKYHKYAILGEDDINYDEELITNIYKESNFILLNNTYDIIINEQNEKIFIGGVSSFLAKSDDTTTINNNISENKDIIFKIILIHEPDYVTKITDKNEVSLILGGHSHHGQVIIPMIGGILNDPGAKKYTTSPYKIGNTLFYISNGVGISKYEFRLFNKPSINFYRINKK